MGETLGILINQRAHDVESQPPVYPQCGQAMKLHEIRGKTVRGLDGRMRVERNYYVYPSGCGQTAFPLDQCLGLRREEWSEGAGQVATLQGLSAPSFELRGAGLRTGGGGESVGGQRPAHQRRIWRGDHPGARGGDRTGLCGEAGGVESARVTHALD